MDSPSSSPTSGGMMAMGAGPPQTVPESDMVEFGEI